MSVADHINRIFFILSYVSQHQGIRVSQLANAVGLNAEQLIRELEFISLIGKPPFKPDDYVDIYVENDRVFVEFDQSLNRPLRLIRSEAVALLLSLELLDPELDPEGVDSLRRKIQDAVEHSVDAEISSADRVLLERPPRPVSEHFRLIREAIEEKRKIEITYFSLNRNRTSRRVVRPYHLMKRLGAWYLTGYCERRKDLRTFKFERILSVRKMRSRFEPPSDLDLDRFPTDFRQPMGEYEVQIQFDRRLAPWLTERWGEDASENAMGVLLTLSNTSLEFASRLVLSHLPYAEPIAPPEFVEKVREDVRELLQHHGVESEP
ncbi:MAG TPA: WYL domain-containing protein, partial [Acidobacteriota bacterium]|nr:WYL domain-containing protein [Acidobacteriota bacterium]HRR55806.1 WYL domain-containing protein [Acidobacteriota bacterium]HRV07550.1 WYL domain-containing protein [Acidobacteriota bacterium]